MSAGAHAARGSFRRSVTIHVGRAVFIVLIAVGIGVVLLQRSPSGSGQVATSATDAPRPPAVSSPGAQSTAPPATLPVVTTPPTSASPPVTTAATPVRAPQDIQVLVANGTTVPGLAGRISATLHDKGYNTLGSANSSEQPTGTIIYFTAGYGPEAAVVAQILGLPTGVAQSMPTATPVASLNGANLLVVAGPDLARAPDSTTTTVAPVSTPTTVAPNPTGNGRGGGIGGVNGGT